jgi:hypothetical protein
LFLVLTFTSDERLRLAESDFLAGIRGMTWIGAVVLADRLLPTTRLSTGRGCILALSLSMAKLLAEMDSALEFLATW